MLTLRHLPGHSWWRGPLFILLCSFFLTTIASCGNDSPQDNPDASDSTGVTVDPVTGDTIVQHVVPAGDSATEAAEVAKEEAAGKYRIDISPKAGETFSYRLKKNESMTAGDFATSQKQTFDVDLRVVRNNPDGTIVLGVKYNRIQATVTMPSAIVDSLGRPLVDTATGQIIIRPQTINFDTKQKGNVVGAERYRAFIGREVLVTITDHGGVKDVASVDDILNTTLKSLKVSADTLNRKALEMAKQGIKLEFGLLVSQIFFSMAPDSAITPGFTWAKSDSLPVAGLPATTTYAYTFTGVKEKDGEKYAQIDATLRTSPQLPKKNIENEYLSMKIEGVNISGEGKSVVSLVDGFPLSRASTIRSSLQGTGALKDGPRKGKMEKLTMKESTAMSVERIGHSGAK